MTSLLPWSEMISMRNRLIHGYDAVNLDIVWNTVQEDVPLLIKELKKVVPPEPA